MRPVHLMPTDTLVITTDVPALVEVTSVPSGRFFSERKRDTVKALRREVAELRQRALAAEYEVAQLEAWL